MNRLAIVSILLIGCNKEDINPIDNKACYECTIHTWSTNYNNTEIATTCNWTQQDANNFESTAYNGNGVNQTINCKRQ